MQERVDLGPEGLPFLVFRFGELGELFRVTNPRKVGIVLPAAELRDDRGAGRAWVTVEVLGPCRQVGLEPAEGPGAELVR